MDPQSSAHDLGEAFRQVFELTPALDEASRNEVYRIRHDVYCRDLGWEPIREDGQEKDEFDRHSFHCLLRRRGSGEPVDWDPDEHSALDGPLLRPHLTAEEATEAAKAEGIVLLRSKNETGFRGGEIP